MSNSAYEIERLAVGEGLIMERDNYGRVDISIDPAYIERKIREAIDRNRDPEYD